jgi:hypothetical protein
METCKAEKRQKRNQFKIAKYEKEKNKQLQHNILSFLTLLILKYLTCTEEI